MTYKQSPSDPQEFDQIFEDAMNSIMLREDQRAKLRAMPLQSKLYIIRGQLISNVQNSGITSTLTLLQKVNVSPFFFFRTLLP